jgi:hypothetical protein
MLARPKVYLENINQYKQYLAKTIKMLLSADILVHYPDKILVTSCT